MTRLIPVNLKMANWEDGMQVDESDMMDEQSRNTGIDAATVNNFFGSGVIEEFPHSPSILDSSDLNSSQLALLDSYSYDGQNVYIGTPLPTVSDLIDGVNLAVEISGCRLDGAANIKVSIIGDSFGGDLIHDDLTFNLNGTQITRGRYKSIRAILFANFAGNLRNNKKFATEEDADSYGLIGRCWIREAKAMEVSADPILASQVGQPSMYWNDFPPATYTMTETMMLQAAIGADKSLADLNIGLSSVDQREIVTNDVTTRIGQKFLATGTNIQKISTLLSVKFNPLAAPGDGYKWSGDVVLTLNALQTEVECPVSPTPDTALDFDPDPAIIGQIALSVDEIRSQGVVLSGSPQVVDFVFTGSNVSDPLRSTIEEGRYYIFTISRAGDTSVGILQIEEATNTLDHGYMSIYDGSQWVNIAESSMWFAIYGDYVKISDGIAYDAGIGVQIPRIAADNTNTEVPYIEEFIPFYTVTHDAYNYVLLEVTEEFSDPEQDQRTGNQVYSRVTPSPEISLIASTALTTLLISDSEPVLLAAINDRNPRGNPLSISGQTCYPGLVMSNTFNILQPDADILQNNLVGSILFPATSCGGSSCEFRIIKQTHYNDAYGDVNGDGEIDATDLAIVNGWLTTYGGSISIVTDWDLFVAGTIDTMQFFRADVNGDGVVNNTDRDAIEDYIDKNISTFTAGSTFSRTELKVENMTSPLTAKSNIPASCCAVFSAGWPKCVDWRIDYFATWIPDLLVSFDTRRLLPTTFTDPVTSTGLKGQNNFYIPGDLLIDGSILNPNETFYSVDLEVNHLSLNIPVTDSGGSPVFLDGYAGLLLFDNFVAESSNGLTPGGFAAMKYADGSYVQIGDFVANRVKITAALQSVSSEYTVVSSQVKDIIGLYYEPTTSYLMLYIKDGYQGNNLAPSISTKVLMTAYLKHAGFINQTGEVTKAQMLALLGI